MVAKTTIRASRWNHQLVRRRTRAGQRHAEPKLFNLRLLDGQLRTQNESDLQATTGFSDSIYLRFTQTTKYGWCEERREDKARVNS